MEINVESSNCYFFQALASETRLRIIEILKKEEKNIKDIADILNVSTTIIARHVNQLEEAGLVTTVNLSAKRGLQKICRLNSESILLILDSDIEDSVNVKKFSIPVGQYSDYQVIPTCGLAGHDAFIGIHDDSRYFSHPDHNKAGLIWFTQGWLEYRIPSYMIDDKKIKKLSFNLELCSEYPHFKDDYKSDINFSLNNQKIAVWTSPGNFGDRRGKYNPPWWNMGSEYGVKLKVSIKEDGTYIGKEKVSNIKIMDIRIEESSDLKFRISCPHDTENPGGVTLFGKGFGDYDQDIDIKIEYE